MRTFAAALVAGLVAATPMTDMEFKFINYVAKFNKSYGTKEEYAFRMEQFAAKELAIQEENASQNSYTLAHNKMSDWTHDEYRQLLGGLPDFEQGTTAPASNQTVPSFATGWNWIDQGAVNPVQDQGQCGSCWAFASVACMEGAWQIAHGTLYKFAEQQLVDCVKTCMGCNGGW
jgi:cathepsin L